MRTYAPDSPHAAARIAVLALLCDGHAAQAEVDTLLHPGTAGVPAPSAAQLREILRQAAEDLLATGAGPWPGAPGLDGGSLAAALDEVADPQLRRHVLAWCLAIARADGHLSEGELAMLDMLERRWGRTGSGA